MSSSRQGMVVGNATVTTVLQGNSRHQRNFKLLDIRMGRFSNIVCFPWLEMNVYQPRRITMRGKTAYRSRRRLSM